MIREILDSYAKSRKKDWLHDRTRTIGASEMGGCARRLYWVKTENQPDDDHVDTWGARMRGSVMEDQFWLKAMRRRYRKKLLMAGNQQVTLQDRYVSATPDGLVIDQPRDALSSLGVADIGESGCFLAECKSIDPRANLTEAKSQHAYQVQVQLGLVRSHTRYKPDYAVISYIDASFWHEVVEFVVKFDQEIYDKAHARAVRIKTASSAYEMKPEGWITGGGECEYCPFVAQCGVIRRSVPERIANTDPQFKAEMEDLCAEHNQISRQVDAATAELNEVKQKIKDRLREKDTRKLEGVVTWYPVKGRVSYDMVAIRQAATDAGVDVEQYSTVGEPTDGLRILAGSVNASEPRPLAPARQSRRSRTEA